MKNVITNNFDDASHQIVNPESAESFGLANEIEALSVHHRAIIWHRKEMLRYAA
jgi:hypothetical protein